MIYNQNWSLRDKAQLEPGDSTIYNILLFTRFTVLAGYGRQRPDKVLNLVTNLYQHKNKTALQSIILFRILVSGIFVRVFSSIK